MPLAVLMSKPDDPVSGTAVDAGEKVPTAQQTQLITFEQTVAMTNGGVSHGVGCRSLFYHCHVWRDDITDWCRTLAITLAD